MRIKKEYYKNLANTVLKGFEKRFMEGYYCESVEEAKKLGLNLKVGNLYSSDTFYDADPDSLKKWAEAGSVAVEMEAAGLYLTARRLRKNALAICTISDLPFTGEACTAEERQNTFTDMMKIALEAAVRLDK